MLPPTGMPCNRAVLVSIDVLRHMHGQHPDKAAHMNLEQRKEGRAFKIDRGRRLCRQARVDGGRLQDWATALITHVRADWWRKRPSMANRSCLFSRRPQPQRSASGLWRRRGRRNLARSAQASALCPAVGQVLPQANASGRLGGTPPPLSIAESIRRGSSWRRPVPTNTRTGLRAKRWWRADSRLP